MPTYFVIYLQPFVRKTKGKAEIAWRKVHKSRKATSAAEAAVWKDEVIKSGGIAFGNQLYRRELVRFAEENGPNPRILAGK